MLSKLLVALAYMANIACCFAVFFMGSNIPITGLIAVTSSVGLLIASALLDNRDMKRLIKLK